MEPWEWTGLAILFWTPGLVLLAMQDKQPAPFLAVCPTCQGQATMTIKRSCDTILAVVLVLLFPLVGLIYVLVTMNKYKVYCGACQTCLGEGKYPRSFVQPLPVAPSATAASHTGP